jgi:hypothetical protein
MHIRAGCAHRHAWPPHQPSSGPCAPVWPVGRPSPAGRRRSTTHTAIQLDKEADHAHTRRPTPARTTGALGLPCGRDRLQACRSPALAPPRAAEPPAARRRPPTAAKTATLGDSAVFARHAAFAVSPACRRQTGPRVGNRPLAGPTLRRCPTTACGTTPSATRIFSVPCGRGGPDHVLIAASIRVTRAAGERWRTTSMPAPTGVTSSHAAFAPGPEVLAGCFKSRCVGGRPPTRRSELDRRPPRH